MNRVNAALIAVTMALLTSAPAQTSQPAVGDLKREAVTEAAG